MRFFSGFGFANEWILFKDFLDRGEYTVAGFSYGAQKALRYVLELYRKGERIQKLQLLSPAYFNGLSRSIKQKEIVNFAKNPGTYMRFFYKKALYPATIDIKPFIKEPTLAELKELLFFEWRGEELQELRDGKVEIEIYLGELDKIVDTSKAHQFFKEYGVSYLIKGVGHLLR